MKVSVIMTVKNGATHLKEAISSVQAQTYSEFELITVDDGSSDGTLSILEEYAEADQRIRFVKTGGVGRSKALNIAVDKSSGCLITNLDADDVWHPEKLRIQVEVFMSGFRGLLCTRSKIINNKEAATFSIPLSGGQEIASVAGKLFYTNPVNHSSVMFRREDIIKVGGYNEARKFLVDYELWCRLVKAGVEIYQVNQVLVGKRIHAKQSFENKKRLRYLYGDFLLRARLISDMDAGVKFHFLNCGKFAYGLLPQRLRSSVKMAWLAKKEGRLDNTGGL